MSSGCDATPLPGATTTPPATQQPISSGTETAQMPSVNLSSMAMYPTVIGWAILYIFGAIVLLFIGAALAGYASITDYWSTFVWSSLVIALIALATINGSYAAALKNMYMCPNSLISFIKVAMSLLALITVILCYIMYYEFGTNKNTETYMLVMLHVNFLASLLNLCLVTIHQLSVANTTS